jgi:hypothetical protein
MPDYNTPQEPTYLDRQYGYRIPVLSSFQRGLNTRSPKERLAEGYTPYAKNVLFDENDALTRTPGTSMIITDSNNQFSFGPCYNLYTHITEDGVPVLIYQGVSTDESAMKLWYLERQKEYPADTAMTDFTPSDGINRFLKMSFCSYWNSMWFTNGVDPLYEWGGPPSTRCTKHWDDYNERFRFITVHDGGLFAGRSSEHPQRVIYSDPNPRNGSPAGDGEEPFYAYYHDGLNYLDFPTKEGDPVMWLEQSPWGSLIVFKIHSIWEVIGSPRHDTHSIRRLDSNVGCVDGWTVQRRGDMIFFASDKGIYVFGKTGVVISQEDMKLKAEEKVTNVTTEISNVWDYGVNVPSQEEKKYIVKNGTDMKMYFDFDGGGTIQIVPGCKLKGTTNNYTCRVTKVILSTGSWSGGDAAGTLWIRDADGSFEDDEQLNIIEYPYPFQPTTNEITDVATVNGVVTFGTDCWDLQGCQYVEDDVLTGFRIQPRIEFALTPSFNWLPDQHWHRSDIVAEFTQSDSWLSFYNNAVSSITGDDWFAQGFRVENVTQDYGFPDRVIWQLKKTGTLDSSHVLKVKLVLPREVNDVWQPDNTLPNVLATGTIDGDYLEGLFCLPFTAGGKQNGGYPEITPGDEIEGITSGAKMDVTDILLTSGKWEDGTASGWIWGKNKVGTFGSESLKTTREAVACASIDGSATSITAGIPVMIRFTAWRNAETISHWQNPPGHGYNKSARYTKFLMLIGEGFDSSNYIEVGYKDGGGYTPSGNAGGCHMFNSNRTYPSNQTTHDFKFYMLCSGLEQYAEVVTDGFNGGVELDTWGRLSIHWIPETIFYRGGSTVKTTILDPDYCYYQEGGDGANPSWGGGWTQFSPNVDRIVSSDRWIRFKLVWRRPGGGGGSNIDSFSLIRLTASYWTVQKEKFLMTSAVFDDRYWFSGGHGELLVNTVVTDEEDEAGAVQFAWTQANDVEYCTIPHNDSLNPHYKDFSMTIRWKGAYGDVIDGPNAEKYLVHKFDDASPYGSIWGVTIYNAEQENGHYIKAYINPSGTDSQFIRSESPTEQGGSSPKKLMDDEYHIIVITMDRSGNGHIYIDGTDVTYTDGGANDISGYDSDDIESNGVVLIGTDHTTPTTGINGTIDTIQYYERVLTTKEIAKISIYHNFVMNSHKLRLYVPFEDESGETIALDASGYSHFTTLTAVSGDPPQFVDGKTERKQG